MRYNISHIRFPNTASNPDVDDSSLCITRDRSKCILCGDCVRVCNEVQNVGAIDFAYRGSKMTISTVFDKPIFESNCVGCGQCALACPTGAIVVKDDTQKVWKEIYDKNTRVSVQIAPAVRVALGKELGLNFDELPAWVNYCEKFYPELLPHVSTCRSPMQMFASIIKEEYSTSSKRLVHVAVMPCTAKKFEAARKEFKVNGVPNVDYVLTTQELVRIVFSELEPEAIDMPFGTYTGAGVIFGVSGGVTEAVLRRVVSDKSPTSFRSLAYTGVRGMNGVKEASVMYGDRKLKVAVVSGLKNAGDLIERIKAGEHYDLVEVMACPGGCINGGGQPFVQSEEREKRGKGLYSADKLCNIKSSEENPLMMTLYKGILKGRVHELLHVDYASKKEAK